MLYPMFSYLYDEGQVCRECEGKHLTVVTQQTIHQPNVGLMLGQRRRRWTTIRPTLGDVSCLLRRRLYRLQVLSNNSQ